MVPAQLAQNLTHLTKEEAKWYKGTDRSINAAARGDPCQRREIPLAARAACRRGAASFPRLHALSPVAPPGAIRVSAALTWTYASPWDRRAS